MIKHNSKQKSPTLSRINEQAVSYWLSLWDKTTGGFRFALHQPPTLVATAYTILGLELVNGLALLTPEQETGIISFLMSASHPDGSFVDPLFDPQSVHGQEHDLAYFQEETTTFCQQALDALLAPPPPPRNWPQQLLTDAGLVAYFESFPWQNPWLDSNRVMFLLSQFIHEVERHQRVYLLRLIDVALDWLDLQQNPETGLWGGPYKVSLLNAMAATFHFTFFYNYRGRPIKYVNQIIDSCLALQDSHGLFSGANIGHTCLDYDALDLLAKASLSTNHRADEVAAAMNRAFTTLLTLHNAEDGGFAHCKERIGAPRQGRFFNLLRRFRLSRLVPPPVNLPVTGEYHTGWRLLSAPTAQSSAFSTWFRLLALYLAAQQEWLYQDSTEKMVFRRLPFLGYHNPLAIQAVRLDSLNHE